MLLKRDNSITAEAIRSIFSENQDKEKEIRRKAKRKRNKQKIKQIKETLIRGKLSNSLKEPRFGAGYRNFVISLFILTFFKKIIELVRIHLAWFS